MNKWINERMNKVLDEAIWMTKNKEWLMQEKIRWKFISYSEEELEKRG